MKFTVYKIASKNPELTCCYIGSTKDLKQRTIQHKSNCINIHSPTYHYRIYQYIRENGGFNNFEIINLRDVDIDGDETKGYFERMYFEIYGGFSKCLNQRCPDRKAKETSLIYYYKHKEQILAHSKLKYQKTKNIIALIEQQQPELII